MLSIANCLEVSTHSLQPARYMNVFFHKFFCFFKGGLCQTTTGQSVTPLKHLVEVSAPALISLQSGDVNSLDAFGYVIKHSK